MPSQTRPAKMGVTCGWIVLVALSADSKEDALWLVATVPSKIIATLWYLLCISVSEWQSQIIFSLCCFPHVVIPSDCGSEARDQLQYLGEETG